MSTRITFDAHHIYVNRQGLSHTKGQTFVDIDTSGVPEPTTMLLLGLGIMGIVGLRRKFMN